MDTFTEDIPKETIGDYKQPRLREHLLKKKLVLKAKYPKTRRIAERDFADNVQYSLRFFDHLNKELFEITLPLLLGSRKVELEYQQLFKTGMYNKFIEIFDEKSYDKLTRYGITPDSNPARAFLPEDILRVLIESYNEIVQKAANFHEVQKKYHKLYPNNVEAPEERTFPLITPDKMKEMFTETYLTREGIDKNPKAANIELESLYALTPYASGMESVSLLSDDGSLPADSEQLREADIRFEAQQFLEDLIDQVVALDESGMGVYPQFPRPRR